MTSGGKGSGRRPTQIAADEARARWDATFGKKEQVVEVKGNTYCLGTGCMAKCSTCQHVANWNEINDNELTVSMFERTKASLIRIDESQCQMTSGSQYLLQCTENK